MTRRILSAELLAIGTEITVGETRDTNSSEIARALVDAGVAVTRITALPDRLDDVREAFAAASSRADLVVSTGGLGPTPDDLTREAIAALVGETPAVDPGIESWLRELWARRGIPFPEINLKQAWLIPAASALANPNGTAPGWWVDLPGGRVLVAMPGPPREMRPMWVEQALPRLRERGLGRVACVRTYRLAGIGESAVADLLGEALLRSENPIVATYARAEAVDVRISAVDEDGGAGEHRRSAEDLVDEAESIVLATLGRYVWARDDETWSGALGSRLEHLGWTLATSETGTGGTLIALLGQVPWLRLAESVMAEPGRAAVGDAAAGSGGGAAAGSGGGAAAGSGGGAAAGAWREPLMAAARAVRERAGADVGVAVRIEPVGADTAVRLAIATPTDTTAEEHLAFLSGPQGRSRAPLITASALLTRLRAEAREEDLSGR